LTVFSVLAYSFFARPATGAGRSFNTMRNVRFYYFAFTYRFSYGRGGEGQKRARVLGADDLKS